MPSGFTLQKNERLKSRKLIEQVFSKGKKFSVGPCRVFYLPAEGTAPVLQVGVGVSAKNFRSAVDRNRIKRLLREAWRLQKKALYEELKKKSGKMAVFIIYTAKELPQYKDVYPVIGEALRKVSAAL